ncbi:MAG: MFS transporter [Candidatus Zixiibacteriota bacterium]
MTDRLSVWKKDVIGWSLYDFANTIYSMNIVSLYLKRYIVEDLKFDDRYFDIPFSASMLIAALVLPALGALSDQSAKKKIFLFLFTLSCCTAVGLMAFVPESFIAAVIVLFIIANFSYEAGQPFYNALLYSVADGQQARYISGIGVSFGYVGSILGMVLVLPFVTGSFFGIDIPFLRGWEKPGAFVPTALLFFIFTLPLFAWVKEQPVVKPRTGGMRLAYREVWQGIRDTRKYPGVLRFLIADYFFEDTVMTVILNIGIYCSLVLGMADQQITTFLIISTISAVIGSFLVGRVARTRSLKQLVVLIVVGWVVALTVFVFIDNMTVIWVLGSFVGILMGGLWTTTRPMLAEMVPREELGRFFGLFALSGRAAAVLGPLVWTAMVFLFKDEKILGWLPVKLFNVAAADLQSFAYKMAVLSLVMILLGGLVIFRKVPPTPGGQLG